MIRFLSKPPILEWLQGSHCAPHFENTKLPRTITLAVVVSPKMDRKHNINEHFEILINKLLTILRILCGCGAFQPSTGNDSICTC